MNRNNIWVHGDGGCSFGHFGAVIGQIDRWRSGLKLQTETARTVSKPTAIPRSARDTDAEVLVKFKPNVSVSEKRKIAGS